MPFARRLTLCASFLVASGGAVAAAAADGPAKRPFEALDVFELEYASDPQISPDGSDIAYVRRSMDVMTDTARSNIWLLSADGASQRPLFPEPGSYGSPRWSPDGDRLAYVAKASGEGRGAEIFVRYMDDGTTVAITNLPESPGGLAWSPDGTQIAFAMFVQDDGLTLAKPPKKPEGAKWAEPVKVIDQMVYRRDGSGYARPGSRHVFVVSADGGTPRRLTDGAFDHGSIEWSADGASILFSANRNDDHELDPVESDIFSMSLADKSVTRLTDRDGPDTGPTLSPDGKRIAYLGFDDKRLGYHGVKAYVMNTDGSGVRDVSGAFDRSIDDISWMGNEALLIQYDDRGRTLLGRLDFDGKVTPLIKDIGGTAIGRPYTSGGFTATDTGVVAYTSGRSNRPADIAILRADKTARRLTRLNDDLAADIAFGDVEELTWKSSADDLEVQGWILKPPQFDPSTKYPMILEIHGGPFAAYGPQFSAEAQLYAAAGYVVLYTNPRGSTSYGADFANEIHHNYPGQDYDDLMSGVDALIAKGYVDKDQLFVTGGSGGGVLSAWIVGKTGRFAAAAVAKPVINWTSFALTADGYPFFYKYWFDKPPWEDNEAYWKRSPLSLVGNVTTPTMLITGEADYRTPMSETEQFYQALKLREVETAMVRVPGASHLIAGRPSNLVAKVGNILGWFDKYRTDAGDADGVDAEAAESDEASASE